MFRISQDVQNQNPDVHVGYQHEQSHPESQDRLCAVPLVLASALQSAFPRNQLTVLLKSTSAMLRQSMRTAVLSKLHGD